MTITIMTVERTSYTLNERYIYWAIASGNKMYAVGHMDGVSEIAMYECGKFEFTIVNGLEKEEENSRSWTYVSLDIRLGYSTIYRGSGFKISEIVPFEVPCT